MKIEVIGNSGCKVEVVREDTKLFVLKSTEDPKYLGRLALQAEKQKAASDMHVPNIIVPKVYEITKSDAKTEVRMDYVYSQNYIDYFENAGVHEIDAFVEAMIAFVEQEIKQSPIDECSNEVLMTKFEEVAGKVAKRADYNDELKELLNHARMRLKSGGGYASHSRGLLPWRLDFLECAILRTAVLFNRFLGFVRRDSSARYSETASGFSIPLVMPDVSTVV